MELGNKYMAFLFSNDVAMHFYLRELYLDDLTWIP